MESIFTEQNRTTYVTIPDSDFLDAVGTVHEEFNNLIVYVKGQKEIQLPSKFNRLDTLLKGNQLYNVNIQKQKQANCI